MENNTQDKGFTLVELLIVIVILGILATVTVFAVRGITERGQANACETDKKTFETAIEAYYALDVLSKNGGAADPDQDDLVGALLIREASTNVIVTPGVGNSIVTFDTPCIVA
jgi:prepilin-type N-terminal cleavage/methylation domain-containing protein